MNKLFIAFVSFLVAVSVSFADHDNLMWSPSGLPLDDHRGPWFATIDLEATQWAWIRQSQNTRKGDTALRFEVRPGDCFTAKPHNPASGWDDCTRDRERSEIRERWLPLLDQEVWYEWSMFIPNNYEYIYPKQIFFQWHDGEGGPVVYFQLNRNNFLIDILTKPSETTHQYKIGELPKNQWIDFTVRAVWSDRNNGNFTLWIDDQFVMEHVGPNMYPQEKLTKFGPFVKMGIYRSHLFRWKEDRPLPVQVLYFDEYRRGGSQEEVDINNHQGD